MVQNVKYKELAFLILPQNFLYQKKLSWGLISCFWLLRVELLGLATPRTLGIKNLPGSGEKDTISAVLAAKLDNLPGQDAQTHLRHPTPWSFMKHHSAQRA